MADNFLPRAKCSIYTYGLPYLVLLKIKKLVTISVRFVLFPESVEILM